MTNEELQAQLKAEREAIEMTVVAYEAKKIKDKYFTKRLLPAIKIKTLVVRNNQRNG